MKINYLSVYDLETPQFAYVICKKNDKYFAVVNDGNGCVCGFQEVEIVSTELIKVEQDFEIAVGDESIYAYYYIDGQVVGKLKDFLPKLEQIIHNENLSRFSLRSVHNFLDRHDFPKKKTEIDLEEKYSLASAYHYGGEGREKNIQKAYSLYLKHREDDPKFKFGLAYCYEKGLIVNLNLKEEATRLFDECLVGIKKQAENGNKFACFILGVMYDMGYGLKKDIHKAVIWYKRSAEQGYANALRNLGMCYHNGNGVKHNAEEAVRLFKLAAEQGDAMALNNLGSCYQYNRGVEKDIGKAIYFYELSANKGHAKAQNNLGICYELGYIDRKNIDKAVELYKMGAKGRDMFAQYNLGRCYHYGKGVLKDINKAVELYTLAAHQSHILAQYVLGNIYEYGESVIEKDANKAVSWYQKVTEHENKKPHFSLKSYLNSKKEVKVRNRSDLLKFEFASDFILSEEKNDVKFDDPIDEDQFDEIKRLLISYAIIHCVNSFRENYA
ncbi:MAG: sel1 repeat family protein [Firmicutes bacterium]|nr:sel1 repeat family protein [Bacillota bacterium]